MDGEYFSAGGGAITQYRLEHSLLGIKRSIIGAPCVEANFAHVTCSRQQIAPDAEFVRVLLHELGMQAERSANVFGGRGELVIARPGARRRGDCQGEYLEAITFRHNCGVGWVEIEMTMEIHEAGSHEMLRMGAF